MSLRGLPLQRWLQLSRLVFPRVLASVVCALLVTGYSGTWQPVLTTFTRVSVLPMGTGPILSKRVPTSGRLVTRTLWVCLMLLLRQVWYTLRMSRGRILVYMSTAFEVFRSTSGMARVLLFEHTWKLLDSRRVTPVVQVMPFEVLPTFTTPGRVVKCLMPCLSTL